MNNFFESTVWEQAWKNDTNSAINKMKKAGIEPTRAFDHKAKIFDEQSFSDEGKRRTQRIMNWIEGQGVDFREASILDIGAASGVFSVPFAQNGASVTSLEPNVPLAELLKRNNAALAEGKIQIVTDPFEHVDVDATGWKKAFDFVFVSMCPVITDWDSVEKVLSCARKYVYISMPVGSREHSLVNELWPLLTDRPKKTEHLEMGYLLHLLLLKGYAFESLVSKETKTVTMTRGEAFEDVINWLSMFGLSTDDALRRTVLEHLERAYPADKVEFQQGGRFGKVLIRLQDEQMYAGKPSS